MKPQKGICESCNEKRWYSHKAKKLCSYCNQKRKDEIKKTQGKKKYRYVKKPTGERELFKRIWETRPHVCEHCHKPLDLPRVHYFAHIKGKGAYPELRLEESNIKLMCYDFINPSNSCHYLYDNGVNAQFMERKDLYK